jgi:hypothetical protein
MNMSCLAHEAAEAPSRRLVPARPEASGRRLLKQLHCVGYSLRHTSGDRNADKTPGEDQLQRR